MVAPPAGDVMPYLVQHHKAEELEVPPAINGIEAIGAPGGIRAALPPEGFGMTDRRTPADLRTQAASMEEAEPWRA